MGLDLELRIHAPIPEVVIVRVGGTVNRRTAPVLAKRVGHQLSRAPHVVVDLGDVTAVDPGGLAVLLTLHQHATDNGTEIHLVRADHEAVRRALRTTGLDRLFTLDSTAEAVIAGLPREATFHPRSPERTQSTGSTGSGWVPGMTGSQPRFRARRSPFKTTRRPNLGKTDTI